MPPDRISHIRILPLTIFYKYVITHYVVASIALNLPVFIIDEMDKR